METIGEINEVTREEELNFEWRIKDFFSLSEEEGECYESSSFTFAGDSWYLEIYPYGDSRDNSVGFVGVYIFRSTHVPPINLKYSLGLKTSDGKIEKTVQFTRAFDVKNKGYGKHKLVKRSELSLNKSELVPSGVLTIVCTLEYSKSTKYSGNISTTKCSYCKKSFDAEHVSSHEEKCLYKSIMCPRCNGVVELSKWLHHECEMERIKATEKILEDLENILDSKEYSDVTIKVKDEEFKLHRNILAGRNPYFQSMFTTDMKEKNTGVVSIDDCEPGIFKSFIFFVYTGKIQTLSDDNVCDLFEVADKYQEDQLKSECLAHMKNKISIENFCSFMVLALRHDEKELIKTATDFFCRNTKQIILTVKWQTFMKEYLTQANELFIKTFDHNVK